MRIRKLCISKMVWNTNYSLQTRLVACNIQVFGIQSKELLVRMKRWEKGKVREKEVETGKVRQRVSL